MGEWGDLPPGADFLGGGDRAHLNQFSAPRRTPGHPLDPRHREPHHPPDEVQETVEEVGREPQKELVEEDGGALHGETYSLPNRYQSLVEPSPPPRRNLTAPSCSKSATPPTLFPRSGNKSLLWNGGKKAAKHPPPPESCCLWFERRVTLWRQFWPDWVTFKRQGRCYV